MSNASRYLIVFAVGAVLGTFYDSVHVVFGVLTYANPHFWILGKGQSLWVPLEFGVAGVIGIVLMQKLSRRFTIPVVGARRVFISAVLLLSAYFVTAVLVGQNGATTLALIPLVTASLALRRRRIEFLACLIGAAVGPLSEAVISWGGLFRYAYGDPIPYWLPLLWLVASGLFVDFSSLLLRSRRVHA